MSTAATTSTVEHSGHGPSRCLGMRPVRRRRPRLPSPCRRHHRPPSPGAVCPRAVSPPPPRSQQHTQPTQKANPHSMRTAPSGLRTHLQQARVAVGLAALHHRRTGDRATLAGGRPGRRDTALTQLRQEPPAEPLASQAPSRCPHCGQYQSDEHTCPVPDGMPSADYSGHRGEDRARAMLAIPAVRRPGHRRVRPKAATLARRHGLQRPQPVVAEQPAPGHHAAGPQGRAFRGRAHDGLPAVGEAEPPRPRGEKAIWILAPMTRKIREDAADGTSQDKTIVTGFKGVPVFNVSQTEVQTCPLPLPAAPLGPTQRRSHPGDPRRPSRGPGRCRLVGYQYEETVIPAGLRPRNRPRHVDAVHRPRHQEDRRRPAPLRGAEGIDDRPRARARARDHVKDLEEYRRHRGRHETDRASRCHRLHGEPGPRHEPGHRRAPTPSRPGYIASWSRGKPEAVVVAAMDRATKAFNTIRAGS